MLAPNKPRILIIQTAFIGDVILATSLIEFIAQKFPNANIDFFLRKGNESIVETNPKINKVYVWNKSDGKYTSLIRHLFQIRAERYDYVLNIQRFFNSGFLTAFSGAKKKIGFDKNPLSFLFHHKIKHKIPHEINGRFLHEVQRNASLTAPLFQNFSLPNKEELPLKIYFTDTDTQKVEKETASKDKYFVLAPSSVWYTKQWHANKWKELISRLDSQGHIYLIGAPTDLEYTNALFDIENKSITNLCGKLSLRQSALLMKNAHRVFVNDSAPLHLASSVNANISAIFCSTVPDFGYTPISNNSQTFSLTPRLECMPCGLHGKKSCPKEHFNCSNEINTEEVYRSIF